MRATTVILLGATLAVAGPDRPHVALASEPTMESAHPGAAPAGGTGDAASRTVKGKVAERIDASNYSYLRLVTAEGELWAAVPRSRFRPAGSEV